jgi:3-isopropylmalate/(R)-2-methylmalate dehydratase large subunit
MRSMTITEKILAAAAGRDEVKPGEFINARLDLVMMNDVTAPIAIKEFRQLGARNVFDRDKIALVASHYMPAKDVAAAEQLKFMREFAREQEITHYFEVGRGGIEHALLPERGLVLPGMCVIGADSHTCTYGAVGAFATGVGSTDAAAAMATGEVWLRVPASMKFTYSGKLGKWVAGKDLILYTIGKIGVEGANYRAMEFTGEVIENLPISDRLTMCNMAIEAGGKSGIVPPDAITREYVEGRAKGRQCVFYASDRDAEYVGAIELDCDGLEPLVAVPHLPSNVKGVSEVRGVRIDQALIGSCTNGRIEDLRIAAAILRGKKVAPHVRLVIIPATQEVFMQALNEGLLQVFVEAGAAVSTPTCGPCLGGHMGVLADGEVCVSTTNRNFVGRMGHKGSQVYLCGPAVAAASAIAGEIVGPEDIGV